MNKKQVRSSLIKELNDDLLGPREPDEELDFKEQPIVHYITGVLAPSDEVLDSNLQDSGETDEETKDKEETDRIPFQGGQLQGSIGISFATHESCKEIKVEAEYGKYEIIGKENEKKWKRFQKKFSKTITAPDKKQVNENSLIDLDDGINLEYIVISDEKSHPDKRLLVWKISLVNRQKIPEDCKEERSLYYIFQPFIRASTEGQNIVERKPHGVFDDKSIELLYRKKRKFSSGYGCATSWNETNSDATDSVWTEIIPSYAFAIHSQGPEIFDKDLSRATSMEKISSAESPERMKEYLLPLVESYREWIKNQESKIDDIEQEFRADAMDNLKSCETTLKRIEDGIDIIFQDTKALDAFKFSNKVISMQMKRKINVDHPQWKPFQIAFILLNIKGIVCPEDKNERGIIDLLWFPTGAGKTEAYLGLAAFTMAYRRLKGVSEGIKGYAGVSVISRYTLRALTTQQFERATSMICACELERKKDERKWGSEKFGIGLYVGNNVRPNKYKDAVDKINGKTLQIECGEPRQLRNCPWCGKELNENSYKPSDNRINIYCTDSQCEFSEGKSAIPIMLTDDEIYWYLPTFLIATADKFAQLLFNENVAMIFGRTKGFKDGRFVERKTKKGKNVMNILPNDLILPPPDLIIQDELHLLSGPLGSMMGLYEAAIDILCTRDIGSGKRVSSKIVASTATIKGAEEQTRSIFNRKLKTFPPQALDINDCFFSKIKEFKEDDGDKDNDRIYVGICCSGKSKTTTAIRTYASLLQKGQNLLNSGITKENIDPYWTLVAYFLSIKELGGLKRRVTDDIPDRIELIKTFLKDTNLRDDLDSFEEFTSRMDSEDILNTLKKLELKVGEENALSVLLSTNMVSVGLDVDRLGLMVVNGQPKHTSEYIQATGRVGRKHPGLIVTLYANRPRDISHYEDFKGYHLRLYSYVERQSVTPFSPRARDKGLSVVFVGLLRALSDKYAPNDSASKINPEDPIIIQTIDALVERVSEEKEKESVKEELKEFISSWRNKREEKPTLRYHRKSRYSNERFPVLFRKVNEKVKEYEKDDTPTPMAPNSLRSVEPQSGVFLKGY